MRQRSMRGSRTGRPAAGAAAWRALGGLAAALTAVLIQAAQPLAAEAGEGPALAAAGDFVAAFAARAVAVLRDESLPPSRRDEEFRRLLFEGFDTYGGARFALGRGWRTASEDQRSEFVALFRQDILRMGKRLFEGYEGEVLKVNRVRPFAEGKIVVETRLSNPEARINEIDFLVGRSGEGFQILDVWLQGFSVLETYRSELVGAQFRGGVEGVMRLLRRRLAN